MPKRTYELEQETIDLIDKFYDELDGKTKSNVINRAAKNYLKFVKSGKINDKYLVEEDPSIGSMERK